MLKSLSMSGKVTGLGGIFVQCANPAELREWYKQHLGFNTDQYGTSFEARDAHNPDKPIYQVWSTFNNNTDYFQPSQKQFMINLRVDDMDGLLKDLAAAGIPPLGEVQVYEYGKFAHIMDPDGTKIELWEPNDEYYGQMAGMYITK